MALLAGLYTPAGALAPRATEHLATEHRATEHLAALRGFAEALELPSCAVEAWSIADGVLLRAEDPTGPDRHLCRELSDGRRLVVVGILEAFDGGDLREVEANAPTEAYLRRLEAADGEFVALLSEPARVHVVTDRFGARPTFWRRTSGGFAFSTHVSFLHRLAGLGARFDPLGVLQLLQYQHTLGAQTIYEGVERIPPATRLTFDRDGVSMRRYWRLQHTPEEGLDVARHADLVFEAFEAATRARCRGRSGFTTLSGGLDSRMVAACLPSQGFYAQTRRTEGEADREVRVAAEICRRLGLRHEVIDVRGPAVSSVGPRVARLTGAMTALHAPVGTMMSLDQMLQGDRFKLGGGPGDVLAGSYVPSLDYANPAWTNRLVEDFVQRRALFGRADLQRMLRREVVQAHFASCEAALSASFEDIRGPTAAHRVTAWAMTIRQPAFTFNCPLTAHPAVSQASPHLGARYAEAMLRLPARWLFGRSFYQFMIHRCLPQLRDVIYANTGALLSGRLEVREIPTRVRPRERVVRRLRRLERHDAIAPLWPMLARIPGVRGRGSAAHYRLMGRDGELMARLREAIHEAPAVRALVDVRAAERFLRDAARDVRFMRSNPAHAQLLGGLASLCYADAVIDEDRTAGLDSTS